MENLYTVEPEYIEEILREQTSYPIHTWRCPCGEPHCKGYVLYAQHVSPVDGRLGFCFMATQTYQPEPPYPTFHVDNIEDFDAFLHDERVPKGDRFMFGLWFAVGLREAILNLVTVH